MNLLYLYIICRFIFCQQISVFLLFTKSSTLSDHFIFLLRFQFFIGKDQLVLTDIIIFYEIFFAKLGMVRQKIAFLCIGIHAAFHSCFDLSSGRCSKRGIYCTGSKKSFVIMKSGYILFCYLCAILYTETPILIFYRKDLEYETIIFI